MARPISTIEAIEASVAQKLMEAGYESAESILDLSDPVAKLTSIRGIGEKTAKIVYVACGEALGGVVDSAPVSAAPIGKQPTLVDPAVVVALGERQRHRIVNKAVSLGIKGAGGTDVVEIRQTREAYTVHSPNLTIEEARKLGKQKWSSWYDGGMQTKVQGRRFIVSHEDHATLKAEGLTL